MQWFLVRADCFLIYVVLMLNDVGIMAVPIAVIFSILASFGAYYNSDKIVLSLNFARPATREENQRMYDKRRLSYSKSWYYIRRS